MVRHYSFSKVNNLTRFLQLTVAWNASVSHLRPPSPADNQRLKAGKLVPTFLLGAESLGFDPTRCVVFGDSLSGIKAAIASGATVIAVCTSHERSKIEVCGAHYIVKYGHMRGW